MVHRSLLRMVVGCLAAVTLLVDAMLPAAAVPAPDDRLLADLAAAVCSTHPDSHGAPASAPGGRHCVFCLPLAVGGLAVIGPAPNAPPPLALVALATSMPPLDGPSRAAQPSPCSARGPPAV